MDPLASEVVEAAYAVGIGLAIGLEREHSDLSHDATSIEPTDKPKDPAREVPLGVRTFGLLALVGWVLAKLGDANTLVQPVGILAVVGLLSAQFVIAARRVASIGATTEIAAIAVLVEGGLVHTDRRLAVVLGLATALLLVSKPWMRRQVVRLRHVEVVATIQLAVLVACVLPLLPTDPVDPWGAVPPRKVGLFVVLIGGVEYVGYVLTRFFGAGRGAALTGLVGGLSSSTAVTVSMARASKHGEPLRATQLATLLANVVMCVRVVAIAALLAPPVAWRIGVALAATAVVLVVAAALTARDLVRDQAKVAPPALANPFSLVPALSWGALLCAILVVSRLATRYLGESGFLLSAAASGVADVDAISLAATRGAATHTLSIDVAALSVVIAVTTNSVAKSIYALVIGGKKFGARIAVALGVGGLASIAIGLVGSYLA